LCSNGTDCWRKLAGGSRRCHHVRCHHLRQGAGGRRVLEKGQRLTGTQRGDGCARIAHELREKQRKGGPVIAGPPFNALRHQKIGVLTTAASVSYRKPLILQK